MIVSEDWIWLHMPKCGGTTVEAVLHSQYDTAPGMMFDETGPGRLYSVHDSIANRQAQCPEFDPAGRPVYAVIRRLPHWILSRVHFQLERSATGSPQVTRAQLCVGKYRQLPRRGGPARLRSADQTVAKYVDEVTEWMTLEALSADMLRVFGIDMSAMKKEKTTKNVSPVGYVRDLNFWFRPKEIERLYEANPVWAALEERVYGNLLTLG